jgi:hypothetical protein
MLKISGTIPVKTRLPAAAWAVASAVTLFSLLSTLMHPATPTDETMPRAERTAPAPDQVHQAKV